MFIRLTFVIVVAFAAGSIQGADRTDKTLPKGAVQVSPGVYKHTDSSGKAWIYRKNPFGYAKTAAADAPVTQTAAPEPPGNPFGNAEAAVAARSAADVIAIEDGENVRFERPGPFGAYKWSRKKADLTKEEQNILDRSRAKKSEAVRTKE